MVVERFDADLGAALIEGPAAQRRDAVEDGATVGRVEVPTHNDPTLIVLDARDGDPAELVDQHAGYAVAGGIPCGALNQGGVPVDNVLYYRSLQGVS